MRKEILKQGLILVIVVLLVGTGVVAGSPYNLEKSKGTSKSSISINSLSNCIIDDDLQKCIDYHQQVIDEEEQYKQLMEEEYLLHPDSLRINHEYMFPHPSNAFLEYLDDYIFENRVPKPRPLPTGNTLYVGGSGPGNYSKIQDAVDNAEDGDIVFVYDDSSPYYENIVVNKSIILLGENKNTTVIDGKFIRSVIQINVDFVNVSEFTIRHPGYDNHNYESGILIMSDYDFISDVRITGKKRDDKNPVGILLLNASNITIAGNNIENNSVGIAVWDSRHLIIKENTFQTEGIVIWASNQINWDSHRIENNTLNGKPIRYYKNCNDIIVPEDAAQVIMANCSDSIIQNTNFSYGTIPIQLGYSYNNLITNNIITHNSSISIWFQFSSKNTIFGNTITNSGSQGIYFSCSSNNIISHNTIINKSIGIWLFNSSNNNTISNNTIANNIIGIGIGLSSNNNTIIGNMILNNRDWGIDLDKSLNNIVIGNTITGNGYDMGHGISLISCSGISIIGNNIISNGNNGIYLSESSNSSILKNTIIDNRRSGIFIGWSSSNNILSNNTVANHSEDGITIESSNNIVCDNIVIQNRVSGILVYGSNSNNIINNNCISNGIDGIVLISGCSANTIDNNTCLNSMKGIAVRDSSEIQLVNNNCLYNRQGILLNNANNTWIENNNCSHDNIGVYLYKSNNNSVVLNRCDNSVFDGIALEDSNSNTVTNNFLGRLNWVGLYISTSFDNNISYNEIWDNIYTGVALMYTHDNTITQNNIYKNAKYGLVGISQQDDARHNWWGSWRLHFTGRNKIFCVWAKIFPWKFSKIDITEISKDMIEQGRQHQFSRLNSLYSFVGALKK